MDARVSCIIVVIVILIINCMMAKNVDTIHSGVLEIHLC